jgi:integrase/recombinase XerC
MLVKLDRYSGLRRNELAELTIGDIHADFIMVRKGKGLKDRAVPLPPIIAGEINRFCQGRPSEEKVFDLSQFEISNKFSQFAKKAGVKLHAHSIRHKYAQALVASGADINEVKELMGHTDINTTQMYLAVSNKGLREAVNRLEQPTPNDNLRTPTLARALTATAEFEVPPL